MRVLLLPLGTPTPAGNVYTKEHLLPHLEENSKFMTRLKTGQLMGELERFGVERKTIADIQDLVNVYLNSVCLRVESVSLEEDGLYGNIQPFGPYGSVLQKMIDRQDPPVISMRSINRQRTIVSIIAFDMAA